MRIFNRNGNLDFSEAKVHSLSESILDLKNLLNEIGTSIGSQELNNVLAAAMKKDPELFKKYVFTNELFGGSGALWEIYCGNEGLQEEFNKRFVRFCQDLKNIGIKSFTINRIIKLMK